MVTPFLFAFFCDFFFFSFLCKRMETKGCLITAMRSHLMAPEPTLTSSVGPIFPGDVTAQPASVDGLANPLTLPSVQEVLGVVHLLHSKWTRPASSQYSKTWQGLSSTQENQISDFKRGLSWGCHRH